MPRTVNVEARAVRREAFVDVALRLIQLKGYEQMSVQDVLDELDASRGAFYYYFDSKDAIVLAFYDQSQQELEPVIEQALAGGKHLKERLAVLRAETGDSYEYKPTGLPLHPAMQVLSQPKSSR